MSEVLIKISIRWEEKEVVAIIVGNRSHVDQPILTKNRT